MCVAIAAKFILLDLPSTSSVLSLEESQLATVRLLAMGMESGTTNRLSHLQAFKAAVSDYRTYLFILLHPLVVGAATISYFIPTITLALGYDIVAAQYMTIAIYIVTTISIIITAFSADRLRERR